MSEKIMCVVPAKTSLIVKANKDKKEETNNENEIDTRIKHMTFIKSKYYHLLNTEKFEKELSDLISLKRKNEDILNGVSSKKENIEENKK